MSTTRSSILPIGLLLAALLALSNGAAAAEAVGRIYFVSGGVFLERGAQRIPAEKEALIESGDVIVTEADGRVQWRMADDSFFVLRPNTSFKVDTYQFQEGSQGSGGAGGTKAAYEFIKGGVRTLTGLIGRTDHAAYNMRSPIATLGIRGTDYTQVYCGDCSWAEQGGNKIKPGLYVRVDSGEIEITNKGGSLRVKGGQYAYVSADSFAPELLPEAPAVFLTWSTEFEFVFPGLDTVLERLPRIEPIDENCIPVPSPNKPCP
jgi:hypothetical protein